MVTDQGDEWGADFSSLLLNSMVEHRHTSANRPQSNGAAERAVQCVKRSLKKECEADKSAADWPKHLPFFRLGYNCSKQASTRFAPYTLLYGFGPTIPPAIKERMEEPIDFENQDAVSHELLVRQVLMKENMAKARTCS